MGKFLSKPKILRREDEISNYRGHVFPISDWKILYSVSRKIIFLNYFRFGNSSVTEENSATATATVNPIIKATISVITGSQMGGQIGGQNTLSEC